MKKLSIIMLFVFAVSMVTATTIYDIQYTENPGPDNYYPSPLEGQTVTVEGVVVAVDFKGYADNIFISMPEGGAWNGVYCYATGDSMLAMGDMIEITGLVSEYYGLTEINEVSNVTVLSSGNAIPEPVVLTTAELAAEEAYEGVFVELNDVYVSSPQDDFGQWYVVDASLTPAQIEDGFFYLDSVDPPIEPALNDFWAVLRGTVTYSYDEYELNPRFPEDMMEVASETPNTIVPASALIGNYPNPFNPETTIEYSLTANEYVEIGVYNLKGEKVNTLVNGYQNAGNHQVTWNGENASGKTVTSGMYFYQLNNTGSMKRMVLLK